MRRPLRLRPGAVRPAGSGIGALLKPRELDLEPVDLPGHFQHRLVLLGDVALQPGQAFLETINPFV